MPKRRAPDPPSNLDPRKQLSAAFYNLHEARLSFENASKISGVPSDWPARMSEINELLDYLKRRVLSFQDELDELNDD